VWRKQPTRGVQRAADTWRNALRNTVQECGALAERRRNVAGTRRDDRLSYFLRALGSAGERSLAQNVAKYLAGSSGFPQPHDIATCAGTQRSRHRIAR
jgi:aminoglycoside N3'-acetyltransferase